MRRKITASIIILALGITACGEKASDPAPVQEEIAEPGANGTKIEMAGASGEKETGQEAQNYGSAYAYSETERLMQKIAEAVPVE